MEHLPRAFRLPLVPLAAAVLALAVWGSAEIQRSTSAHATERTALAQALLTSMLDQETGLRGYLLTRDANFLEPYTGGNQRYVDLDRRLDAVIAGNHTQAAIEDGADRAAARWRRAA